MMSAVGDFKSVFELIFGDQENLTGTVRILSLLFFLLAFSGLVWGIYFAGPNTSKQVKVVLAIMTAMVGTLLILFVPQIAHKLSNKSDLVKIFLAVICSGALAGLMALFFDGKAKNPDEGKIILDASGGKGGDAIAKGKNSTAVGGKGGAGGVFPGMAGMDAVAEGEGTMFVGGDGGNAPTWDGVGGKGARGTLQNMGYPTALWNAGMGGRGANSPEATRRLKILSQIRQEYLIKFPQDSLTVEAGIEDIELQWVNKRLEEKGEVWRVLARSGVAYALPALSKELLK
jgi:hypothetical protein